MYECQACGGQFWTPFRNPGADWYEHDERYADRNADPILHPNKKHIDIMEALCHRTGRVLDVGCGVGNFLAYARAKGWECWGIDFDADAVRAGKQTFGLACLDVASLSEFAKAHQDLRFDLITFFDVFEHIDNHNEFLTLVSGMLAPGGSIALSVPYRRGWRWLMPHDLPPRHLTRWDERALTNTLARHGFKINFLKRLPANWYYLILKLRFKYGRWASFGVVQKAKQDDLAKQTPSARARPSVRVQLLQLAARTKDTILFGIPALLLWFVLLPTPKRYTDLYVIATLE